MFSRLETLMNLKGNPKIVVGLGVDLPEDNGEDESFSWAATALAVIPKSSMARSRQQWKGEPVDDFEAQS